MIIGSQEFRPEEWQIKADLALFEAKSRAKGSCSEFEEEMDERYIERQKLKEELREAIEQGQLQVAYQPMFLPDGSRIDCCEALSRWHHPERGMVPPDTFVQIAEDMGIVSGITHHILNLACHDCMARPKRFLCPSTFRPGPAQQCYRLRGAQGAGGIGPATSAPASRGDGKLPYG